MQNYLRMHNGKQAIDCKAKAEKLSYFYLDSDDTEHSDDGAGGDCGTRWVSEFRRIMV